MILSRNKQVQKADYNLNYTLLITGKFKKRAQIYWVGYKEKEQ